MDVCFVGGFGEILWIPWLGRPGSSQISQPPKAAHRFCPYRIFKPALTSEKGGSSSPRRLNGGFTCFSWFTTTTSSRIELASDHSRLICNATVVGQQSAALEELFSGERLERWQAAREPLLALGLSTLDADLYLTKAFGWTSSPYWGEEKAKKIPDREDVGKTLQFLRDVGLSDADSSALLQKFPEILGCELEGELAKNVKILAEVWGISGGTLRGLLLRNPKVLGYNVDCKGDCMAQCTRCWARF